MPAVNRITFKPEWIWLLWFSLVALWVGYLVGNLLIFLSQPNGLDFIVYYRASRALVDGKNLYYDFYAGIPLYIYPPLLAQLFAPIVAITPDFRSASILWYVINASALVGMLVLLSRYARTRSLRILIWVLPVVYIPVFHSFLLGQVTIIMAFFAVAAWAAYRSGRRSLAGFLLVFITWIKIYPSVLLLYFVWKRDWRVVFSAAVSSIVLMIFQIAISGLDAFIRYFRDIFPQLALEGRIEQNHSNHSILGFAQKMFLPAPQVIPVLDSPLLVTLTRLSLYLLITGVFVYLTTRPFKSLQETPTTVFDLEYSLVLTMALLMGSTLILHGMVSMLLPIMVLCQNLPTGASPKFSRILWIVFAITLMNVHLFLILGYLMPPSDHALPAPVLSLPFVGMMILWALIVSFLYRTVSHRSIDSSTFISDRR